MISCESLTELPTTNNSDQFSLMVISTDSNGIGKDSNGFFKVPTPDPPRILPTQRTNPDRYTVIKGDSLAEIAHRFNVRLLELIQLNELSNPNFIFPGQVLRIPVGKTVAIGPDTKIIPDAELVFSNSSAVFNLDNFLTKTRGYLKSYQEFIEDESYSGPEIIMRVSREYSVNPRLLAAVLEFQAGWLTSIEPEKAKKEFPIIRDASRKGLYRQISWAANTLNQGYYLWRKNAISHLLLIDGSVVPVRSRINAGTVGIQHLMANLYGDQEWRQAVSVYGLFQTYWNLFGNPFNYSIEPLIPTDLTQPQMQLPFEKGVTWSCTGGPHGGWGVGSAWAALDFAPPGNVYGCILSDAWITAVADGVITWSLKGSVIQDLDMDGNEHTGWSILYHHVESRERIPVKSKVRTGQRIGHPSCEGGVSNGTHVHIARRYNGEWIPADGHIPFVMEGWIPAGSLLEYDGYLTKKGITLEAWDSRKPENQIQR